MRAKLKALLVTAFHCLLFSACVSHESPYRIESTALVEKIGSLGAEELFPVEFNDLIITWNRAENLLAEGDVDQAGRYYLFLMGKGTLLEKKYLQEVIRRKEDVRKQEELRRSAALEIQREIMREQENEREKERVLAKEKERAAVEAKRQETARFEARRKAERLKQEREVPLAARHTVRRGETLPQIAAMAEVYSDSSLWPLLYKSNRDQIRDPRVLWPGQVLRIPRNHDKNDVSEARRFAGERPLR